MKRGLLVDGRHQGKTNTRIKLLVQASLRNSDSDSDKDEERGLHLL